MLVCVSVISGVDVWCLAALSPSGVVWCGRLAVAIGPGCVAAGLVLAKCLLCVIISSCQIYDWSLNTSRHHATLPINGSCSLQVASLLLLLKKSSPFTFSATSIIKICLKHLQTILEDVKINEVSMGIISAARFWWRRRGLHWRGSDIKKSSQELFYFVQTSCWALCVLHGFGVRFAMRMCHDHWWYHARTDVIVCLLALFYPLLLLHRSFALDMLPCTLIACLVSVCDRTPEFILLFCFAYDGGSV